jgi:hypothetical protein
MTLMTLFLQNHATQMLALKALKARGSKRPQHASTRKLETSTCDLRLSLRGEANLIVSMVTNRLRFPLARTAVAAAAAANNRQSKCQPQTEAQAF